MKLQFKLILGLLLIFTFITVRGDVGVIINKNDGTQIKLSHEEFTSVEPQKGKGVLVNKSDGTSLEIQYTDLNSIETYFGSIVNEITPGKEVDLGLSVKWAGWNVGASSPEQYGGFYAWGETEEKSVYHYDTYKYYNSKTGFINIGSSISGTQYDVAHVKWGNGWRMPTKEELEELETKCTWTGYTYNGVKGCKVTGPNGNSIFLPCAGYRHRASLRSVGDFGYFWSSSIYESIGDYAWDLYVSVSGSYGVSYGYDRFYGHSVRPVR